MFKKDGLGIILKVKNCYFPFHLYINKIIKSIKYFFGNNKIFFIINYAVMILINI